MSSVILKYFRGSAVGIVGKVVTLGAGYGTLYLLNRILSQDGYGSYTTMLAVATVAAFVVQFGLRQSTIQRVSELSTRDDRDHESYVGTTIVIVTAASVVGAGGFFALADQLATYLGTEKLVPWFRYGSILLPGIALRSLQSGVLRGMEQVEFAVVLEQIVPGVVRVAGLTAVLSVGGDLPAIIAVIGASYYLPVLAYFVAFDGWRFLGPDGITRSHWKFSLELLASGLLIRFVRKSNIFLLTALIGLNATAGFQVAVRIATPARFVDSILTAVLQPRISKFIAEGEYDSMKVEFSFVRDISMLAGVLAVAVILFVGRFALGVFGAYKPYFDTLLLLVAGNGVVNTAFGPIGQVLIMGRNGRSMTLNTATTLAVLVAASLLLVPKYGTFGAAGSFVLAGHFLTNAIGVAQVYYVQNNLLLSVRSLSVAGVTLVGLAGYMTGVVGEVDYAVLLVLIGVILVRSILQQARETVDIAELRS